MAENAKGYSMGYVVTMLLLKFVTNHVFIVLFSSDNSQHTFLLLCVFYAGYAVCYTHIGNV